MMTTVLVCAAVFGWCLFALMALENGRLRAEIMKLEDQLEVEMQINHDNWVCMEDQIR